MWYNYSMLLINSLKEGDGKSMEEKVRQNGFLYRMTRLLTKIYSAFVFKRHVIRNELKGKKGPFVIIANHQCAMDFTNLCATVKQPLYFVISDSFYRTMPVKGIMTKLGVIPKRQFETGVVDMRRMKAVVEQGKNLVIYPAGLMCEDGVSTPIPEATYRFLKWLGADIYMAKSYGSYFAMPKWAKGTRPGRVDIDIYKVFDKEELKAVATDELVRRLDEALAFDAYREQETRLVKHKLGDNIEGLENVLYYCPNCKREFTIKVESESDIVCTECGYSEKCDEYGFLHKTSECGEEIRYVSDWSRLIQDRLSEKIANEGIDITERCDIYTIDDEKKKYVKRGEGCVTLKDDSVTLVGTHDGEAVEFTVSAVHYPSVPFSPGKYIELQHGDCSYRCYLSDGRLAQKYVNAIKIMHKLNMEKVKKPTTV